MLSQDIFRDTNKLTKLTFMNGINLHEKKGNLNNNKQLQFIIDNTYSGLLCDHLYLYIIKLYLYQMNRKEMKKKHILECIYEINRKV